MHSFHAQISTASVRHNFFNGGVKSVDPEDDALATDEDDDRRFISARAFFAPESHLAASGAAEYPELLT